MSRAIMIIRRPVKISPQSDLQAERGRRKENYVANTVRFKSRNGFLGGHGAAAH
jgi:hypothetical protein